MCLEISSDRCVAVKAGAATRQMPLRFTRLRRETSACASNISDVERGAGPRQGQASEEVISQAVPSAQSAGFGRRSG